MDHKELKAVLNQLDNYNYRCSIAQQSIGPQVCKFLRSSDVAFSRQTTDQMKQCIVDQEILLTQNVRRIHKFQKFEN